MTMFSPEVWAEAKTIVPAEFIRDTAGNEIEAHNGSVLKVGGTYYQTGSDRTGDTKNYYKTTI